MKRVWVSILLFVGGFAFGMLLSRWTAPDRGEAAGADDLPVVVTQVAGPDSGELERLRLRVASQAERIEELEDQLAGAGSASLPPELEEDPDPDAALAESFRQRIQERIESRLQGRVEDMAARYGLDESQQVALMAALRQQVESRRALRRGEEAEPFNLDGAVQDILSEDQFEQYLEETQQGIYNRADLLATNQMVRLDQIADLSPEAEQAVYDTINVTAQEMMIAHQEGGEYDMRGVLEERLGAVLTEDQMEAYRQMLRTDRGPGGGMGLGLGPPP